MTAEELAAIEQRFDLPLPTDYREFLQNYPDELVTLKRDCGPYRPPESPAERELHNDAASLIEQNDGVRIPGVSWVRRGGPWPHKYFVIGDDGCGDYWCLDATSGTSAVYFYDHDRGVFDRDYESIREYAAHVLTKIRDEVETNRRWAGLEQPPQTQ